MAQVVERKSVSDELAQAIIAAAVEKARELGSVASSTGDRNTSLIGG